MTLEQQIVTLLSMLGSGFVIGFIFDGYRVLKGKLKVPSWLVFIIDISFGILSALFIFNLLLWSNHGQLRTIIVLILFLGIWIYYLSLSHFFVLFWLKIYYIIYRSWLLLISTIDFIVIKPAILLYRFILMIITFLITLVFFIGRFFKSLFQFLFKGIYLKTRDTGGKLKSKIIKKEGISSLLKKLFKRKAS